MLDSTLLIVVSDHGEGLGEHDLFDHGESLYRTEIGVPLLVVPPAHGEHPIVVEQTVSLRNLPATIVDLAGLSEDSPFPGKSLAHLWRDDPPQSAADVLNRLAGFREGEPPGEPISQAARPEPRPPRITKAHLGDDVISELTSPNPANPNRGRSPGARGPLISLAEDDFVYIRNQADGTEELFNERDDPRELSNLIIFPSMQPVLERFRDRLKQFKAKPADAVP